MLLYHGTSAVVAKKALKEGLKPRGHTGKTNWKHSIESNPKGVYLTDIYAGYFAANATVEGDWGIIEIDTDKLDPYNLLPDEDFLEQATRGEKSICPKTVRGMVARTRWFRNRLLGFQKYWENSLKDLGTVQYRGVIQPKAFTRVSVFDPRSNGSLSLNILDPSISIVNRLLCSDKYRASTRWLMGEKITVDEWMGQFSFGCLPPSPNGFSIEEATKQVREMLDQQQGVKIIYSKEALRA